MGMNQPRAETWQHFSPSAKPDWIKPVTHANMSWAASSCGRHFCCIFARVAMFPAFENLRHKRSQYTALTNMLFLLCLHPTPFLCCFPLWNLRLSTLWSSCLFCVLFSVKHDAHHWVHTDDSARHKHSWHRRHRALRYLATPSPGLTGLLFVLLFFARPLQTGINWKMVALWAKLDTKVMVKPFSIILHQRTCWHKHKFTWDLLPGDSSIPQHRLSWAKGSWKRQSCYHGASNVLIASKGGCWARRLWVTYPSSACSLVVDPSLLSTHCCFQHCVNMWKGSGRAFWHET